LEAREEGLVHAIGITGHGHQTPAVHLEALRRYSFDTVMTPWNFVLSRDDSYRRDYEALLEEVKRQDVGLMAIKTVSKRNWPEGDPLSRQRYATWYEPFDEQEYIDAAVAFVLSYEQITSIPMVGDVSLIPLMLEAEERRMHVEEAVEILSQAPDYSSPFIHIPF
jgi:predicted aldo/keto reductase-like oxidoreductase